MLHTGNIGQHIILREERPHRLNLLILSVSNNHLYPVSQNLSRLMHHQPDMLRVSQDNILVGNIAMGSIHNLLHRRP